MSLLSKLLGRLASGQRPAGRIADSVAPDSTTVYEWDVEEDTTIEDLRARFYKNQQLALRLDPYLVDPDSGRTELIRYSDESKQYLAGDDDVFEYDISVEAPEQSTIVVEARNTSDEYEYDFSVDFSLEHGGNEVSNN